MDQPAHEIVRLEKMLDAFSKYEGLQETRRKARDKMRGHKDLPPITEPIE